MDTNPCFLCKNFTSKILRNYEISEDILNKLKEEEKIIVNYIRALEINPKNAETWNNKGLALDNLGRLNEAIVCFDKALEINPRYVGAWMNKGSALNKLGRLKEAIYALERFIEFAPPQFAGEVEQTKAFIHVLQLKAVFDEHMRRW